MGWVSRRVVGYIVFAVVSAVLGAIAVSKGYISGEPTRSTVTGVIILGVAFLVSFAVTTRMKDRDAARKKREKIEEQWREYYARVYPQFYRQR